MELRDFISKSLRKLINEELNTTLSGYFSNIDLNTEDVFQMIDYADSYKNLYPDFNEFNNEYEQDYYFPSREEAYNNVNQTLEFFNSLPDPISIYRTIKVKSLEDIKFDYLGDSWSFNKESAINFARNHAGGNVLLSAKTKFDNVDWKATLKLHYQFSNTFDGYDEDEIKIIDSDQLLDLKVEKI